MKDVSRKTVILGIGAALLSIICLMLILNTVLHMTFWLALFLSTIAGLYLGYNAFYSTYLAEMIKIEVANQGLTSRDLADLMHGNAKEYPIIRGELRLIIPRYKRAQLLTKLRSRIH